jgi:[ribosomal protein S18]-alanine N-acetyltransferase
MDQAEATEIAAWHYEDPYSFYDWTADSDDLALLLSEETRLGRFFSALDEDGVLVGFFTLRMEGADLVIGLGLRPDLTGRGLGRQFVEAGIAFGRRSFHPARIRLSVAAFNARAIRVYERAGFTHARTFEHETNGGVHSFVEMTRPVS